MNGQDKGALSHLIVKERALWIFNEFCFGGRYQWLFRFLAEALFRLFGRASAVVFYRITHANMSLLAY